MYLRTWAHSTLDGGARSPSNHQFLAGLLRHGSLTAPPDIAVSRMEEQGVPCLHLAFHLPHVFHDTGVTTIPVLIPSAYIGTGSYEPVDIFYCLLEGVISWLAGTGPIHTLIQLYRRSHGQPLAPSSSPHFSIFIDSLRRQPQSSSSGLGQMSGTLGVIEVMQARTWSGHISADYIANLTLSDGRHMSFHLPRSVAMLGKDWLLDWLSIQIAFSNRVQ